MFGHFRLLDVVGLLQVSLLLSDVEVFLYLVFSDFCFVFSNNIDGVSCRPEIIDPVDEEGNEIRVIIVFCHDVM